MQTEDGIKAIASFMIKTNPLDANYKGNNQFFDDL